MSDLKCVRALLAAADRDIEILQLMYDSTGGPDEIFGFHAQQAAEKSLRAVLCITASNILSFDVYNRSIP